MAAPPILILGWRRASRAADLDGRRALKEPSGGSCAAIRAVCRKIALCHGPSGREDLSAWSTFIDVTRHFIAFRAVPGWTCPSLLRLARRRQILASGCRVKGRRSRSRATVRRAALDSVAASWTIPSEEDAADDRRISLLDRWRSRRWGRRSRAGPPKAEARAGVGPAAHAVRRLDEKS